jgi:two-component system chemotaxis sensor kinase CheA
MQMDRSALLRTFAVESEEQLVAMEESLLALERQPDDLETARVLYRLVHTVEGSAATVELPELAELAHAMKVAVDGVRARRIPASPELRAVVREGIVSIRGSLARLEDAGRPPEQSALLARLAALVNAPNGRDAE